MNWPLIAEIFSALDIMVEYHDWDMSCGENASYAEMVYLHLTEFGFPKDRSGWDQIFETAQVATWGVDNTCHPMTTHEIWDFVASLGDSYMNETGADHNGAFRYYEVDLGLGKYPANEENP